VWDIKALPELSGLSDAERSQVERTSLFLGVWDWRTLAIVPPVLTVLAELSSYWEPSADGPAPTRDFILAGVFLVVFMAAFFALLLARARSHARRIGCAWKSGKDGPLAAAPVKSPAATGWCRGVLSTATGLGLGTVIAGGVLLRWWMIGLGAELLIVSLGLGACYAVCTSCRHLQIQLFSAGFGHCPKCGARY
jgi:hypothetical protein